MTFKEGNIPWNKGLSGYNSGQNNPFYGKKHTEISKIKNKIAHLGNKVSEETKHKMSQAHKGKPSFWKGKKLSEETKRKMSLAITGKKNPNFGKKFSKEHRAKLSKAHEGRFKRTNCPAWRGGIKISYGYVYILQPFHPFCNSQGYVKKSRLVMEKQLGRFLKPAEVIHHINKVRNDDRIENLMLFANDSEHQKHHHRIKNI